MFYCVAKNKSFSVAAKELYVSQSAISQNIRQLEQQLGCKLFYRTRTGVELTKEGDVIFEYVERATHWLEQAKKRLEEYQNLDSGNLRVGAADDLCKYFLDKPIARFRNLYPDTHIEIRCEKSQQTIWDLKSGKIDIGFVGHPLEDEEIECKPWLYLHDCFVCNEKYLAHTKERQKMENLVKLPLILLRKGTDERNAFEETMRQMGVVANPVLEVSSHALMVQLAKNGLGIACVTEAFVGHELSHRELYKISTNANLKPRSIGVCVLKNATQHFAVKRFLEDIGYNA